MKTKDIRKALAAIRNDNVPPQWFANFLKGLPVRQTGSPAAWSCEPPISYPTPTAVCSSTASRPTIDELEKILASEEEVPIEILPNGEVRAKGQTSLQETGGKSKP